MIIRHLINCGVCRHPHTLRIQVGNERYQEHTFQCFECEEDIIVGMDCDIASGSIQVRGIENYEQGSMEGTIINLNPNFPTPKQDRHSDYVFPGMHQSRAFSDIQDLLGIKTQKFSSLEESRAFLRKRQQNRIFFRTRSCVMMDHPKTLKEDVHDKAKYSGRPAAQQKTLASTYICAKEKRFKPCCILQRT